MDKQIEEVIKSVHDAGKPIGGLCIAPVLLTKVLKNITVTIGNDEKTATDVEKMGGVNINTSHGEVISDKRNKIYNHPENPLFNCSSYCKIHSANRNYC